MRKSQKKCGHPSPMRSPHLLRSLSPKQKKPSRWSSNCNESKTYSPFPSDPHFLLQMSMQGKAKRGIFRESFGSGFIRKKRRGCLFFGGVLGASEGAGVTEKSRGLDICQHGPFWAFCVFSVAKHDFWTSSKRRHQAKPPPWAGAGCLPGVIKISAGTAAAKNIKKGG